MHSTSYVLGFLCGLLLVLIVGFILSLLRKRKGTTIEYDERQKSIQGIGYKYSFLTLLFLVVLLGVIDEIFGLPYLSLFQISIICLWVSVCVFVTYCVIKDAYFALKSRRKLLIIIFLATGLFNIAIAVTNYASGEPWVVNGKLDTAFTNLLCGTATLYISVVMLIKQISDRRAKGREE